MFDVGGLGVLLRVLQGSPLLVGWRLPKKAIKSIETLTFSSTRLWRRLRLEERRWEVWLHLFSPRPSWNKSLCFYSHPFRDTCSMFRVLSCVLVLFY